MRNYRSAALFVVLLVMVGLLGACGDTTPTTQGFTPLAAANTPGAGGTNATSAAGGATTPGAGGAAIATIYMNGLAAQLGIPVTPGAGFGAPPNGTPGAGGFGGQLTDEMLDQLVKSGQLQQSQADCIRTARAGNSGTPNGAAFRDCGFGGNRTPNANRTPDPNRTPGAGGRGGLGSALAGSADAIAAALKISKDDLKTQLQAGKTLTDIAAAQKVDIQTVKDAITASAKTALDAEVTAGTIQQAQADTQLNRIKTDLDKIVTTKVNGG